MRKSRWWRVLAALPVAGALLGLGSGSTFAGGLPAPGKAVMACRTAGTVSWDYFVTYDNRGGSWPNYGVTLQGDGVCQTAHGSVPVSFAASGVISYANPGETLMWWSLDPVSITIGGRTYQESWLGEDTGKVSDLGMDPLSPSSGDSRGSGVIVAPVVGVSRPTAGTTRFDLDFEKPVPLNLISVVG